MTYFLTTPRLGFSNWQAEDLPLAAALWGEPEVTRWICASGRFTPAEIQARLDRERENFRQYGVQYFPVFTRAEGVLVGCCGLRPYGGGADSYELGIHLRREFWRQGYGREAAGAMLRYAFTVKNAQVVKAGHNPHNTASQGLLQALGFQLEGTEFYPPTGLMHPLYGMTQAQWQTREAHHAV